MSEGRGKISGLPAIPTPIGNEIIPIDGSATYMTKNKGIISPFYGLLGTTFIPQQRV